jgi:CubicO group peptidase (beta-lactamase class C family)
MLVDRGQIIYEAYKEPASKDTVQFSWSMSKSLVAYTIGGMVCDGKIASINDPAKKYAPELEGTVFGDASIKNLLTMSSGAMNSTFAGNAYKTATSDQWMDQRSGATTTLEVIRQYGKKDIEPGQEFRYLANDTQSLALIINNRGGFADNFNKYVWEPTKSNSRGYWLMGKDSMPIVASGFSATTGDWARLAMFTIDAKKNGSQCIKDFMQTATSQQIANKKKRIGAAFNGYGYQTWTNPNFGNGKSYWWVGYGGQRVGVDSDKERIIVVTSHREDYMPDVYKLFAKFQQY